MGKSQLEKRGISAYHLYNARNIFTIFIANMVGHTPIENVERGDALYIAAVEQFIQSDIIEIGVEHLVKMLSGSSILSAHTHHLLKPLSVMISRT